MELSFPFCKTLNNIDRKRGEYLDPASVALLPPHSDCSPLSLPKLELRFWVSLAAKLTDEVYLKKVLTRDLMDKRQKAIYVLFHSAKLVLCQDSQ